MTDKCQCNKETDETPKRRTLTSVPRHWGRREVKLKTFGSWIEVPIEVLEKLGSEDLRRYGTNTRVFNVLSSEEC